MGLLATLLSKISGTTGGSAVDAVTALIKGNGSAGFTKLVTDLKTGGLASEVDSWVSTGANKVATSAQVQRAMGGKLGKIASSLGVSPEQAAAQLATALPHVIDKLTPNGKLPTTNELRANLKSLKG